MSKDETRQLMAFYKALVDNPRDVETRRVFADWLEEHGFDDESAEQRNWSLERHDAEIYLRKFCERHGADYDELLENLVAEKGYCFGDDDGPDEAQSDAEFWRAVKVITGKDDISLDQGFRCAC